MDPITLIIGYGVYKLFTKKAPTPAAAQATAEKVVSLSDQLMAGQVSATLAMQEEVAGMIKALGMTPSGQGHPPDANGVTAVQFLAPGPTSAFTVEEVHELSNLWMDFTYQIAKANVDKVISVTEAEAITHSASILAAKLSQYAQVYQDRTQKKT